MTSRASGLCGRAAVLLLAAALAACLSPGATECVDGRICRAGTTCDDVHGLCVTAGQLSTCAVEEDGTSCGVRGLPGYCDQGVCLVIACGNGRTDPGEVCDDGNLDSGDGCRKDCASLEICGNGTLDAEAGEICDDGNVESGDGCRGDCASNETCGNGAVDVSVGEVCDDGNLASADDCRGDCRSDERCGNGILDPHRGERCDCGDGSGPLPPGCEQPNSDEPGASCSSECACRGECGPPMVTVAEGSFTMGCNPAVDSECQTDELPQHEVFLDAYAIGANAVTQAMYAEYVAAVGDAVAPQCNWDPSGRADEPVVCVAWAFAEGYCAWAGKRLCTEAEWEKAARGTDARKFPWGNDAASCSYAVMDDGVDGCGTGAPWAVGAKPAGASPYGVLDMAGNVWVWVADWVSPDYGGCTVDCRNPQGPPTGNYKIMRGGGYSDSGYRLRASNRGEAYPADDAAYLGIRCCASIGP